MPVKLVVVGDTHLTTFESLPKEMLSAIYEADWVIHLGDYTSKNVLDGFIKLKGGHFKGVYGNADPLEIRNVLPAHDILEVLDKKIGITHPAFGGSFETTERRVLAEFKQGNVDAIFYGHTHEPRIVRKEGILLVNPGKGYLEKNYFGPPTSLAIIFIDREIHGEIHEIGF